MEKDIIDLIRHFREEINKQGRKIEKCMKVGNVDRVECEISEHAPLDTLFCTIKTFDGKEYDVGDLKKVWFGDVRGYIELGENGENEILINFSEGQNAVCETIGRELYCRALRD